MSDWNDDLDERDREIVDAFFDQSGVLVRPSTIRAFNGNAGPAVFLSQLMFWTKYERERKKDFDGWFGATIEEIELRTGMGRTSQETNRQILWSYDLLECETRGDHNQMFFRLNPKQLLKIATGKKLEVVRISDARLKRLARRQEKRALQILKTPPVTANKGQAGPTKESPLEPTVSETQAKSLCMHAPKVLCMGAPKGVCMHGHKGVCMHAPEGVCMHAPKGVCMHAPKHERDILEISRNLIDPPSETLPRVATGADSPAKQGGDKNFKSKHTFEQCLRFAQHLQNSGVRIDSTDAWAIARYRDGLADSRIDVFVANPPPDPDATAAARDRERAHEVAFCEAISLCLEGIHSGGIRSWADAEPIAAGFEWKSFKGAVRSQLHRHPDLLRAFPFEDEPAVARAAGAGG